MPIGEVQIQQDKAQRAVLRLQLFHGLTHRDPADLVGLAQFRLCGQAAAGWVSASVDLVFQLFIELLVQRNGAAFIDLIHDVFLYPLDDNTNYSK